MQSFAMNALKDLFMVDPSSRESHIFYRESWLQIREPESKEIAILYHLHGRLSENKGNLIL